MAFFASLVGCSKGSRDKVQRYVSESDFRENVAKQLTMSPQTVAQLNKHGVTDQANLKLEFFFCTDKEAKGQSLAKVLDEQRYQVACGPAAGDTCLVIVTGWTIPINMSEGTVVAWTDNVPTRLRVRLRIRWPGHKSKPVSPSKSMHSSGRSRRIQMVDHLAATACSLSFTA